MRLQGYVGVYVLSVLPSLTTIISKVKESLRFWYSKKYGMY